MENVSVYKREASYTEYSIDLNKVYYQRIIREIRQAVPAASGKKILDVGCFDGGLASQFIPDYQVFGLEGDIQARETARGRGVHAVLHDLEKPFPFADNEFDGLIAAEIIEHVYDTDFFLREIRRVLKKDGTLVMSIPNIACLSNRIKMLFGGYPRYAEYKAGGAGHIRVYTANAIRSQLIENGFKIHRFVGCNLPMPMHHKAVPVWLKKLAVKGGDFFPGIAGQVIITATIS